MERKLKEMEQKMKDMEEARKEEERKRKAEDARREEERNDWVSVALRKPPIPRIFIPRK